MTALWISAAAIIILLFLVLAGLSRLRRGLTEMHAVSEDLLRELKAMNRNIYGYTKKTSDILGYRLSPETGDGLREIISKLDTGLKEMSASPRTELVAVLRDQEKLLKEINEKLTVIGYNTDRAPRLEDDPF